MEHTKYERLSLDDNSGTVSEPLMGSPFSIEERPTRHGLARFVFSKTTLISYCVLSTTVIIFLTAAVLGRLRVEILCQQWDQNGKPFQAVLGSDPTYMSLDHKYDYLWKDFASGNSVIKLPDSNYGGQPRHAAISMFHQLHCLSAFRNALQQAHEGIDPGSDWQDDGHWPHCLEYMRKTVLCWADGTIERRFIYANGTVSGFIDGSQDVRQCGDNLKLIQFMRDHGKNVTTRPFP